jgi:hypothetical protein
LIVVTIPLAVVHVEVTIKIMTQIEGRKEEIVIHNVYNPTEKGRDPRHKEGRYEGITTNSALPLLESALEKHHGKEQLVVGGMERASA